MSESPRIRLQKLARIDRELAATAARQAQLLGERAGLLDAMAEKRVLLETGRKLPEPPRPAIAPVSNIAQAQAQKALKDARIKARRAR